MSSTVSDLILRGRRMADLENSQFVSDVEWLEYTNAGYADLYDLLVEAQQDYYINEFDFTITSGSVAALPSDFYKARAIDVNFGGVWIPVSRFELGERVKYITPLSIITFATPQLAYRLFGSTIKFYPESSAFLTNQFRMWYVPRIQPLIEGTPATRLIQNMQYTAVTAGSAGDNISIQYVSGSVKGSEVCTVTDTAIQVSISPGASTVLNVQRAIIQNTSATSLITTTITGPVTTLQNIQGITTLASGSDDSIVSNVLDFDEYIPTYAAIRALDKEESESGALVTRLAYIKERITRLAPNRDSGAPERVSDSTSDIMFGIVPGFGGTS